MSTCNQLILETLGPQAGGFRCSAALAFRGTSAGSFRRKSTKRARILYLPRMQFLLHTCLQKVYKFDASRASHDAPITPNFPFDSSREIAGDYVKK